LNRANISARDSNGRNSLHYAAELGDETIANFLLRNSNVKDITDTEDKNGITPMDIVLKNHNGPLMELFLDYRI